MSAVQTASTVSPKVELDIRLVTFDVAKDQFALDIMGIIQILKYEGSTEVPKAPPFVEGIIVLRNRVIPIIDLRKRLFPAAEAGEGSRRILVVRLANLTVGLKVDQVRQIVSVRRSDILPAPPLVQGLDARFFQGVVQVDGALVLLLDLEKILSVAEREVLGGTAGIAPPVRA